MKFLFVINCGEASHAFNATQAIAAVRATILELEKVSENGTYSPLKPLPLLNYLEIGSALSHGPVTVETSGDVTTVTGDVIIGYDGDIIPQALETYNLKVTGLPQYCTMDIYLLPIKTKATITLDYDKVKTTADVPSRVKLAAAHLLCMPKADLQKLELESPDDTRIEFLSQELKQHLNDLNANAFNINGLVTAVGLDLYVFPVKAASNGIFTASADKVLTVVNAVRA